MSEFLDFLLSHPAYAYFAVISLVAVIITVYDKIAAKKRPKGRVPEMRLFLVSLLGGSIFMLATMLLIRHKTKHKRFMIGIPVIILCQFELLTVLLTIL